MSDQKPTMEEVAGWLREAGLKLLAADEDAQGNEVLARTAQVGAMGWRSIVEAPKDGTIVDLWESDAKERLPDCMWRNSAWYQFQHPDEWVELMYGTITHFMPLPEPPVKK